jgi:hypothetical protein
VLVTAAIRRDSSLRLAICTFFALLLSLPAIAQTAPPQPNALQRLLALHLPKLDGEYSTYYSPEAKTQALRSQAEITKCANWYSQQLHVKIPVTIAVLDQADWNRIGDLIPYPMPQAESGDVIFMPDSFASYPGQISGAHLAAKLDFISFHETGHLFQHALKLHSPDLFMQEFDATLFATAYALATHPELITATLHSRSAAKQRYTSFEDMDLIYIGVGFGNYDWFQIEMLRLAVFFAKGQDLATLVSKLRAAFPAGQFLTTQQIFAKTDAIRPGFLALAGNLAGPTTLPLLTPGKCVASPVKQNADSTFGIWNASGHPIAVVDDGTAATLPPGSSAQQGKLGAQFQLPNGSSCITYPKEPGYIVLH